MHKRPIRVLCVDDHAVVREGIAGLIGRQADIKLVAAAASGEEAVALFRTTRPDVTLMDLQLPGLSGLEAIRAIRQGFPDARIIVLTMYQGDEDIYRALRAGAVTYLLKDTLADELVRVVRQVHSGKQPINPDIQSRLDGRTGQPGLSPREAQVIELIAVGMRNKEIAALLGISEDTVQVHVKNMLLKLNVHDRTAAVTVALRRGIIHIR